MKRLIVGISGASGVIYGIRLLEVLKSLGGVETHLVMSRYARLNIEIETTHTPQEVEALADEVHSFGNQAASISSGSFKTDGMVIAPCSIKTLSGIVNSYADNLLLRAADVVLKERRKLDLLPRETPLHLGHLRLLTQASEIVAIVMPPLPAFYHRPKTIQDLIDHSVNRVLDLLGIELETDLFKRWEGPSDSKSLASLMSASRVLCDSISAITA